MTEATLNAFFSELEKIAYEHEQARIEPDPGAADMRPPSLLDSFDKKRDKDAVTTLLKSNRPGNIGAAIAAGAFAGGVLPNVQRVVSDVGYGLQGYLQGKYAPMAQEAALREGIRVLHGDKYPAFTRRLAQFLRTRRLPVESFQSFQNQFETGWKGTWPEVVSDALSEQFEMTGLKSLGKKRGLKDAGQVETSLHRRYYLKDMKNAAKGWRRPVLMGAALGAIGGAVYNRRQRKAREELLRSHRKALLDYEINRRELENL